MSVVSLRRPARAPATPSAEAASAPVVVASLEVSSDASVDELYRAGLAYSTGRGVGIDLIRAHQYFNLAASRGSEIAKACRKELADAMTPTEVKTAQRAAREWLSRAN